MKKIVLALIILITLGLQAKIENLKVLAKNGKQLDVTIYKPESKVKLPLLVMGPGNGYHKDLPIFTDLGKQCLENKIAFAVLNWSFYTEGGKRSDKFKEEKAEILSVLDYFSEKEWVDQEKIALGGKSLGSVIAYQAFQETILPKTLILYTPIFASKKYVDFLYPNIKEEKRTVNIIVGNQDIDNCPLDSLNKTLGNLPGNFQPIVVGGDHGLNIGDYKQKKFEKINLENISLANRVTVNHLKYLFKLY